MNVFPSKYQQLEMNRHEKVFARYACNADSVFCLVLLHVNPTMIKGEKLNVIITYQGVVACKFFDFDNVAALPVFIEGYKNGIFADTSSIIINKLKTNLALLGSDSHLRFPVAQICIFPTISRKSLDLSTFSKEAKREEIY